MLNLKISIFIFSLVSAAAVGGLSTTLMIKLVNPEVKNPDCQPTAFKETRRKGVLIIDEAADKGF